MYTRYPDYIHPLLPVLPTTVESSHPFSLLTLCPRFTVDYQQLTLLFYPLSQISANHMHMNVCQPLGHGHPTSRHTPKMKWLTLHP